MLITQKLVMTKDIGCNDNLYGGNLLSWIDEAGAIYSKKATKEDRMVTYKMSEMTFKKPVKVGSIIEFHEENTVRGISSISFKIAAKVNKETIAEVDCVYVCVDKHGNKKPIEIFNKKSLQSPIDKNADGLTKIMYYCPASIVLKIGKENIELLCTQSWDWLDNNEPEFDPADIEESNENMLCVWDLNKKYFVNILKCDIIGYGLSSYRGMIYFK